MSQHPAKSPVAPRIRPAKCLLQIAAVACVCAASYAHAGALTVPNFSFENPSTTFVTNTITNWTQTEQPVWYDPASFGGYPWQFTSGIFANTAVGDPSHIDNLDGSQSAFFFGIPTDGIYQLLSSTYQTGKNYSLTVGVVGQGGGMPDGATLGMQLYYMSGGNRTVIGSQTVTENSTNFPNHTHAYDFALDLSTVQASDAWAGQQIGIEFVTTSDFAHAGGYWDLDNVRLNEITPVPEPVSATAVFALCGVAAQLRRRRRA